MLCIDEHGRKKFRAHSWRNALSGSIELARRAGSHTAMNATAVRINGTAVIATPTSTRRRHSKMTILRALAAGRTQGKGDFRFPRPAAVNRVLSNHTACFAASMSKPSDSTNGSSLTTTA